MKKAFLGIVSILIVFAGIMRAEESEINVKPYGYVRLDALYETGASSHGNYAIWAEDPGTSAGLFYLTARHTRLGLDIRGLAFGDFKATAKVEIDFYGAGAENKPMNYMRHAYLRITNGKLTIIAGQYWDIINPLNPSTINYPVLWGAGNIGYRRPQLSLRYDFPSGKNLYTLQAGIFRTIAADYDGDGIEDGIAGGFPTLQGRGAARINLGGKKFLQLGISGHYGQSKGIRNFNSSSLNVDFQLFLSSGFKLVAEYFNGRNLGAFLGGIAQSIDAGREVDAHGFYVNLQSAINKRTMVSLGYGMDDPSTFTPGTRSRNSAVFADILWKPHRAITIGFEVSRWTTGYLSAEKRETIRFQNSWTLGF